MTEKPLLVYIAGPYSQGEVNHNVRRAVLCGLAVADMGHFPIIPHLFHLADLIQPMPYAFWTQLDMRVIPRCDALILLDGPSKGAQAELKLATRYKVPVFKSPGQLADALANKLQIPERWVEL